VLEPLSTADARHFLSLCKTGRLFDVQDWIASGKSLCVPDTIKSTPLEVALNSGFHSLVELLVSHEKSQDLKNRALLHAVTLKRLDFIELVVSHGAKVSSIPFIDVLRIWEPTIIRYFLDHGSDFITDSPFAVAFGEKIRTTLRPFKECQEKYPDAAPQLQEQADRALRHFCFKGDLKWVSLLMWVGADPRSRGPTLDIDESDDPEERTTAMEAAAYCENVQILKRLKPDPNRDYVVGLLRDSATFGHADVTRYLLELGAKPNDKPNGGSTALDKCLTSFQSGCFRYRISSSWSSNSSQTPKYYVSNTRDTVQLLLEKGARWRPDDARELDRVRRSLYDCEPDVTMELVEELVKHKACSEDTLHNLLRTPAMKRHLIPVVRTLARLGFDVRTKEQKVEEARQKEASRRWALRDLASRYNREKLYAEVWSEPIQHVAKRYGVSDVALAKVCRKLNIPRPGRGYWAIKAAGKRAPRQPALPELLI
jgi:hypothetical protein